MTTLALRRPSAPAPVDTTPLSYKDSLALVGGLSHPSKMPWWGWSTPASACITGGKLAKQEGTVCSGCYALKGFYMFPGAQTAMHRRMAAARNPRFVEAFIIALENLYLKTRKRRANGDRENRFRWFDSGDLQSVEMLIKINDIALGTPQVQHWLPTREAKIVSAFLEKHGVFAPNLCVRISVAMVGSLPTRRPQGLPFATVGVDESDAVNQCPASRFQNNECRDCDACWSRDTDINYPLH